MIDICFLTNIDNYKSYFSNPLVQISALFILKQVIFLIL